MQAQRVKESYYRDRLAASIPGSQVEVRCQFGSIDVLTPDEVIEIKRVGSWKEAIGQLFSYGAIYPERAKRLHVLLPNSEYSKALTEVIKPFCMTTGVTVTSEVEIDRSIMIYMVGDKEFRSILEIQIFIKMIRMRNRVPHKAVYLSGEDAAFMCDVINMASWKDYKFGGAVDQVRIIKDTWERNRKLNMGYFQAKSGEHGWQGISVKNYLDMIKGTAQTKAMYLPQKEVFRQ